MSARRRDPLTAPAAASWVRRGSQWECPDCGKRYPRAGQSHSCRVVSLEEHFRDRPNAFTLFKAFRAELEAAGGPVRLSVARTRIGLITRMTFAAVTPRKDYLRGHFLLRRRAAARQVVRVQDVGHYRVHHFVIRSLDDFDRRFRDLLAESYRVGNGD